MRNEQIQETNLSGWVGGDKEGGMRIALTVWCPRWYLCTVRSYVVCIISILPRRVHMVYLCTRVCVLCILYLSSIHILLPLLIVCIILNTSNIHTRILYTRVYIYIMLCIFILIL